MKKTAFVRMYLLALVFALASASALASIRTFPVGVKRGILNGALYPDFVIDGKVRVTNPSTRILNADNLIIVPASLPQAKIIINYTEDDYGVIKKIWILTAEEAAQPVPKANP